MRSSHRRLGHNAALTLAFLTLAGLTLLPSAQAQDLTLGQFGTTASGTATLTDTGTTASGIYTYNDFFTGTPLSQQNSYSHWYICGPSTANVSGGSITDLWTLNTSTANVSGGSIYGIQIGDSSTANVSGGKIGDLDTIVTSTANISGGSITRLSTQGSSTANVSGGIITYLATIGTSTLNVSGGMIGTLDTFETSTIDVFGTGLTETFVSTQRDYVHYDVTGILQDGTSIDTDYYDFGGRLLFNGAAAVPINPVPEATSVVSFGLLLVLGLGGLAVSARRRKAQAAG